MERNPVKSSHIKSIGHNKITECLEIEFNNGSIYEYYKVPTKIYDSLMIAESHGQYLNHHIKKIYAFKKVN